MWRRLGIEPGERRIFIWGACALFLLGWVEVSVKNVSEVFFLKRVGVELMPLAFLISSLLLVVTTWAFGAIAARNDRLRMLPLVFVGLGMLLVPLWLLVRMGVESAFGLLLIASKQISSIALLVFWIAMGDVLHSRQTKRLFAPMMAGMTVGTILGSFASKPLGEWLGIAGLLPVSAVALLLGGAAVAQLQGIRARFERRASSGTPVPAERIRNETEQAPFAKLWREHVLFRFLLVTTLCSGLLGPMLYFQFQYVADLATIGHGGEERLLAFYARLRGWIFVAVLVIQLGGARHLYRWLGLPLAAVVAPVTYLAGFVGLSIRLSLPAGVGAMAGTKLQDEAVYDPALRVLYSLFPESVRARATALIEGPAKRGGGAVGNAAIVLALAVGSAPWVGYAALPITLLWLLVSLALWRRYPSLLLHAVAERGTRRDALQSELLDSATVHTLVGEMCGDDPDRARLALDLVKDADAEIAAKAFAEAVVRAPASMRPSIVTALDGRLQKAATETFDSPEAAAHVASAFDDGDALADGERADLVQAYARLASRDTALPLLERALEDPAPAVRIAAHAALESRGVKPQGTPALDAALADALRGEDPAARQTAREELRALLLRGASDGPWHARVELLAGALADGIDRAETADALADVAASHGTTVAERGMRALEARDDPDPRVRAALLRFVGHAGQHDQLAWLIDHLASKEQDCAVSAREGVRALGPSTSNALLHELAYGRRSKRNAIVAVMRELDLRPEALAQLYELELDTVEHDLVALLALEHRAPLALLRQRLKERVRESLHTALLFLAAMRNEDRVAALGERLRELRDRPRERAVVVEALDAFLLPVDRQRLLPLLEHDDAEAVARSAPRRSALGVEEELRRLTKDPEELTRTIATGLVAAPNRNAEDDEAVDAVEKMALLKRVSLFQDLTARELMDLARVVTERRLEAGATVVREGEYDDCLYLVVEGVVHIQRGNTQLAELVAGQFFGEIALLEGVARSADAVTRTRARLLGLERTELMKLIDEHPSIAVGLLRTLSRRVRELTDRLIV